MGVKPGTGSYKTSDNTSTKYNRSKTRKDPIKVQTTHPPNITGVRSASGPYKSSDNTSTKYNRSKTRNWTLQKFKSSDNTYTTKIRKYNKYNRSKTRNWTHKCSGPYKSSHPQNITTHPPNITGVRPGTGPYKTSDNKSAKHSGSKTRNWTLYSPNIELDQELDPTKVQTTHPLNIT